ncbi:MAG: zinc-ribbon domain-containing protein, partial [Ruminococcus sp.]|nr:zinc-ribbon domain-containing protein [Ruminococcus sp.]
MKCPQCGTENQSGFKFCVKCGLNLENPNEVNIEQVDAGRYHSEDDASSGSVYTIGSGTFTISDRPSAAASSTLYTADELNDTDEEFDFSGFDEPFIPKLDADRVSLPEQISHPHPQPQMQANNYQPNQYSNPAVHAANNNPYQMAGIPQQNMQQIGGIPQQMYQQPQIIGYDQNGMPVYSQPMMYQQPQIIGYDQNGMPLYGQPVMYQQPQFMGYDQNGMPVYGQPVMYQQPQFMGYDQNGMPVYGQPVPYQNAPVMGGMPAMQGIPQQQMQPTPPPPPPPQQQEEEKRVDVPDDFWEFFDGGKATKHRETSDDFFGRSDHSGMGDIS